MGDGISGWRAAAAPPVTTLRGPARRISAVSAASLAVPEKSLSGNRLLGIGELLRCVPVSRRICPRARCAHRARPWTVYARSVTDVSDDRHWLRDDDYLR